MRVAHDYPSGTGAPLAAPVLSAHQLAYAHTGSPPVFEGVDLQVRAGEIVCLLGGSGCGKSTLLRVLSRLAEPQHGDLAFLGQRLLEPHPRAALLFQQPGLLPWLNVARNVGFGLDFHHQPDLTDAERQERVQRALRAVGLAHASHLRPAQLSGGMAQRVALARAMAREPLLLLADEPFSALDAITRVQMQDLLVDVVHRWRSAALLVTHDIDEAIALADRIVLMASPAPGQPARLLREWTVSQARPRLAERAATAALRQDILLALHSPGTPS